MTQGHIKGRKGSVLGPRINLCACHYSCMHSTLPIARVNTIFLLLFLLLLGLCVFTLYRIIFVIVVMKMIHQISYQLMMEILMLPRKELTHGMTKICHLVIPT